ncbi:MAG TPA: 50S ribosome-binding GTPase, partial [Peptococcaceae bacterium]|nr:50S ribosome-binding GTPase [Peptococcaceae bacterium]
MAKPIVAIVGRPNVGKSTLFNRLTGGRVAIVEDTPGVTRDRLYRDAEWLGQSFTVVDTGGIEFSGGEDSITNQIRKQAEIAVAEADVILLLVDSRAGLLPQDEEIAAQLRKTSKPVILVVNKVEQFKDNSDLYDFYRLGFEDLVCISAEHGLNTGDLLDLVVSKFPVPPEDETEPDVIKIAVVGRPNVG